MERQRAFTTDIRSDMSSFVGVFDVDMGDPCDLYLAIERVSPCVISHKHYCSILGEELIQPRC